MSITSKAPKFIYKIFPAHPALPCPLPLALPVSDLDRRDGFIHMSTSAQLLGTLRRFFASEQSVQLLRIDYRKLAKEQDVRWEDGKGTKTGREGEEGYYPHLYNGLKLGREETDSVALWERAEEGWDAQGWPFEGDDVPA